jgi:hypothetical protein
VATALAACAVVPLAAAQDAPDEPASAPGPNQPLPLWEIGAFAIGGWQAAYPGSDQRIAKGQLLPYALWRGPVLRVGDGGIGVRAYKTPRYEWSVSATGAFGGGANEVRARDGMPAIGTLVELGPALKVNLGDFFVAGRDPRVTRLELPIRAVFDVSDDLAHKGWTFEPRLSHTAWRNETLALSFTGSLLVGDRRLNQMFYGVDPAYAVAGRPAYAAKAGLIATRLGVGLGQRVSDTVRLRWFAQVESVRGAANEGSPLVRAHEDAGVGVSLTWGFWRSDEPGVE